MLEVFPLLLHIGVVFEFDVALGIFIAACLETGNEVCENYGIHTLALIFGLYGLQKQVYNIAVAAYCLEQRIPAEREKPPVALLQSLRQRGHCYAECNQLAFLVHYQRDVVETEYAQIYIDIVVNQLFGLRQRSGR